MKTALPFLFVFFTFLSGFAQRISKTEAIADIDYLDKVIRAAHYNPFLYTSEIKYIQKINQVKSTIPDSIETRPFTLKLGEITGLIDDAHTAPTFIQSIFKADFRKPVFLPLTFVADKKGKTYSDGKALPGIIPAGAEIISVNGTSIQKFYQESALRVGGLQTYRNEIAIKMIGYNIYLSGIRPPFKIAYQYQHKKGIKTIENGSILRDLIGDAFPNLIGKPYSFNILEDKVANIELNTLEGDYHPYLNFFDSCFTVIKQKKIKTLAIDIRKNTGGNSINADLLLGFFNSKKYTLSGGKNWKISQLYKDQLIKQGDTSSNYLKQSNNSIWQRLNCEPYDPKYTSEQAFFNGQVYIITGPMTFSSANMLADGVKQFKLAKLIGEATGENTNDFGEGYHFQLPNSKIGFNVSTSLDFGADCNNKTRHPVLPDRQIETSYLDKIKGLDPVLQYILKVSE
ncbi:S41 family peptidase [Pedobacter jeongneungensis]|uniref:S41 family peptidase n=1 Tax=Pedobacter jeongneungensis TaxID=947309 RepID=A0ABP8BL02_9SPHI